MKKGKAYVLDDIPIEIWMTLGDVRIVWLTKLFNEILKKKHMPDAWRKSILVPIFKNKRDVLNCINYRGIKLISHTMKLWERVIERKLRATSTISDLEKAYDRVAMEVLWWVLEKRGVHVKYIKVIKDMYDGVVTSVRTAGGYTAEFSIRIGLH
ncbi:uncharacterized protein LOC112092777 [Morus notabilis]|uniref:uncharacterized protein LOC112092777 n=1 Tax=Morus notabilis TaxID=981085 RepID=UPI000CED76F9|nr:uncharacterized protein LOC112092777 [Morus notabilis]